MYICNCTIRYISYRIYFRACNNYLWFIFELLLKLLEPKCAFFFHLIDLRICFYYLYTTTTTTTIQYIYKIYVQHIFIYNTSTSMSSVVLLIWETFAFASIQNEMCARLFLWASPRTSHSRLPTSQSPFPHRHTHTQKYTHSLTHTHTNTYRINVVNKRQILSHFHFVYASWIFNRSIYSK